MTNQQNHPITPNPEQIYLWQNDWKLSSYEPGITEIIYVATQAARWGADQELEACCEWLKDTNWDELREAAYDLRADRRPKPPSLKEQALGALYAIATGADDTREFHQDIETIKAALEPLDD